MRHPRLFTSASLLLALAACRDPGGSGTETESGTDTSASEGPPTTTDTGGPLVPELPKDRYFLRLDDTPPPPVVLELDKDKALEVFGEQATREIKLIDLDSTGLLVNVLTTIQNSCGTGWSTYVETPNAMLPVNPAHDCALTELGKTYGASKAEWQVSPEFAMVRLLTMTPRNAVVVGTELADFEKLFKQNGNNFGELSFSDILAASLYCEGTAAEAALCTDKLRSTDPAEVTQEKDLHMRPFISPTVLAETLKVTLMASHPNIANDQGTLPVTLYDALKDMQPLADKFGPIGDHPGLLLPDDADFATSSNALTADFKMIATAESNLRRVDGIDASVGGGEMFLSASPIPLAFDFMDEDKVKFEGIAAVPTVDMRMAIVELPTKIAQCTGDVATCGENLPDSPVGTDYVWSQPPWSLERIVGQAAYMAYGARVYKQCFVKFDPECLAQVAIGSDGAPPGWSVFKTDFMTVKVPAPQYLWEMLLGVAQVAVHNPTGDGTAEIAEGDAQPVFAIKGVEIGLSADELLVEIRKALQTQSDKIADVILGNYWKKNPQLDFFYQRGDDDKPYLYFIAEGDKRPDPADPEKLAAYAYAKPGFFSDPELGTKVSKTSIEGVADTAHEKYALPAGRTVLYMQDDAGDTYELEFTVPASPSEIAVRVNKL